MKSTKTTSTPTTKKQTTVKGTDNVGWKGGWLCAQGSELKSTPEFRRHLTKVGIDGLRAPIYCDDKTEGGGWLLIERRQTGGTLMLNRPPNFDWSKHGNIADHFWFGFDLMHILTADVPMDLLLEINWCSGQPSLLKYKNFQVGPGGDRYRLKIESSQNDSNGEGFGVYDGREFWYNSMVAFEHSYMGWWWNDKPPVSLHEQIGCDIPPPFNCFWFTRAPQRRRAIYSFGIKIRPMTLTSSRSECH